MVDETTTINYILLVDEVVGDEVWGGEGKGDEGASSTSHLAKNHN